MPFKQVIDGDKPVTGVIDLNKKQTVLHIKPIVEVEFHVATWLAIIVFILNFILPGSGTFVVWICLKNQKLRNEILCNAFCQLITAPIIIGWIMAQIYSCTLLGIAGYKPIFNEDEESIDVMRKYKENNDNDSAIINNNKKQLNPSEEATIV